MDESLPAAGNRLAGERVAFVGKLAGMSRREAARLVRSEGATCLESPDATVSLVVVGEEELPMGDLAGSESPLDDAVQQAAESEHVSLVSETQLWQRLGLVETEQNIRRLYTPAMLAKLLDVPVAVIRRWHRRGLIVPAEEVHRLPYFDFREVATARRLAQLLAAGCTPQAIEKKLAQLSRFLPEVERPLAQLSIIVEGKQLLLRQGDGLVEPGGQFRFDFDRPADESEGADREAIIAVDAHRPAATETPSEEAAGALSPDQMLHAAMDLEDEGELEAAAEMYRAVLAAGPPTAAVHFALAETLYRLGELPAARERYYAAVELDEDYVEARANLGCVLAELGQPELAHAAFEGALAYHADYPDAHYHLACLLDQTGAPDRAVEHWEAFLALAPDSPWSEEARARLSGE